MLLTRVTGRPLLAGRSPLIGGPRRACAHTLSFEQFGDVTSSRTAVFLHGMLGSKKNMRTPCREFLKTHKGFSCLAVDLRGHGQSHELPGEENSMQQCAEDLYTLFCSLELQPHMLVAHSLAGKVALKYLEKCQRDALSPPHNAWILDSLPGPYHDAQDNSKVEENSQSVAHVVKSLDKLHMPYATRKDVVTALTDLGIALPVAQWLGTSLEPVSGEGDGVTWVFDLKVAKELFRDFVQLDMRNFLKSYDGDCVIHFVRAGRSEKWTPEVLTFYDEIIAKQKLVGEEKYKKLQLHTMPNVGHWLHSEDLPGLLSIIHANNIHK